MCLWYITLRYNQTCKYHDEGATDLLLFRPRPRPKPNGTLSFLVLPWLLWLQCEEWTWPLTWPWCVLELELLEFTLITTWPFPLPFACSEWECVSPFAKFELLPMCIIPIPSSEWPNSSIYSTSSLYPLIKKSEQFFLMPWSYGFLNLPPGPLR